jgi:predicted esterase
VIITAYNPHVGSFSRALVVCTKQLCSGPGADHVMKLLKDWPQLRVTLADDPNATDPFAEVAHRVGKTPVWMFHGDADPAVPDEKSRQMGAAFKAAGACASLHN